MKIVLFLIFDIKKLQTKKNYKLLCQLVSTDGSLMTEFPKTHLCMNLISDAFRNQTNNPSAELIFLNI